MSMAPFLKEKQSQKEAKRRKKGKRKKKKRIAIHDSRDYREIKSAKDKPINSVD